MESIPTDATIHGVYTSNRNSMDTFGFHDTSVTEFVCPP